MSTNIQKEIKDAIEKAESVDALEALKISAFGKNGQITALMKELGKLSGEERASRGKELNIMKNALMGLLDEKLNVKKREARALELEQDRMDATLKGPEKWRSGSLHPITRTQEDLCRIMGQMGFTLVDGPDIEEDFYNFTGLNFPPDHPAREMHDTFYLGDQTRTPEGNLQYMLKTHVSGVQVRYGEANEPPFRIMYTGRCYRSDYDQTHTPMFTQFETMAIGKDITMAHLKGTLLAFVQNFFEVEGDDIIRFRPSFFPFTEPSVEVDIRCDKSKDKLVMGEGDDWMEILGAGMVHPNVLKSCNIDPNEWQGFAYGAGVERMAMLKYGIPDLRNFFDGDVRWLEHYGFSPFEAAS